MREKIKYCDLTSVGETLEAVVASMGLPAKMKKYNLSKVWAQVVGKRFENRSYPSTLVNNVLKVACENAQVTSELVMMKSMVLEKLKPFAKSLELEIQDIQFSHNIWKK